MSRAVVAALGPVLAGLLLAGLLRAEDEAEAGRRCLLLGPDGKPLAAVVLSQAARGPDGAVIFDAATGGETRTLERGLLDLPTSSRTGAVVWGPGLGAQRLARAPGVVGLRLARAVPLGGTLRFDRGGAAAGVTVLARRTFGGDLVHATTTDENGIWRFSHVAAGRWEVSVRRGDGRLQSLGVFTAGQEDADRILVPGSRVEGQILDGDAPVRTGIGGLRFILVRLPGSASLSEEPFETAKDGTFVLDDVPEGIYEARLVDGTPFFFDPASPRVAVPERGRVELRGWFALRGRVVAGRVEGPRSARVADGRVVLVPDATQTAPPGDWPSIPPATTDAEGRFEIRGVRPAVGYRLAVSARGYAATVTSPFDVSGPKPTSVPTVLLASGWRLEVHARTPVGKPVPGVEIRVVPADRPVTRGTAGWAALARRGVTDAAGRAVLADLPEGDVRVLATSPGVTDVRGLVPYPPSGDVRTWTAILFGAPGLAGRIRAWAGGVLPGLVVRATPRGDAAPLTTRAGTDGRFAFEGLGSEPVDLAVVDARAPHGLALARVEGLVPGRSPPVEITLAQPATLEGRVVDASDTGPAVRILLEAPVFDPADDAFRWQTVKSATVSEDDPRRTFRFEGLSPGPYAVRAVQGDNDSGATTVRLEEAATERVEVFLPDAGRVAGTVLGATDRPLLGAEVRLVRLRGDGDAPGRPGGMPERATDDGGGFVFEDVAPGVWRVEVRDRDQAPDEETIRVAAGESVIVRDLVVGRGGAVEGVVSDGQGRVLDGALLVLEPIDEGVDVRRARTGRAGSFRVEALRAGTWRIRLEARAGPFSGIEVLVEVVADETTEVELTAGGAGRILGRVWRRGRPVPDLEVYLVSRPGGEAGLARRLTARSDGEGRFVFDGLAGGAYAVDVADGGVWSTRPVTIEDGDVLTLDLEAWEGRIPGEVVTRTGTPIADATVIARPRVRGPNASVGRVRTDPQGRFLVVGLPVGQYDLEASAPGLPPGRLLGATAEVEGAERPVTVTLGRGGTLDVTVLGPGGRGVSGTRIWLEDEHGAALHARPYVTGYRGRLRLEGTAPGRLWIRAYARRYGRAARTVVRVKESEETSVDVRLPLPARLAVRVVGARFDPLPRARLELLRLPDGEPVVRNRSLGRSRLEPVGGRIPRTGLVVFDELGPGRYLVRVDAGRRFEVSEVEVEIGALDDAAVVIELGPAK